MVCILIGATSDLDCSHLSYSCCVTWSADASKSCMLTIINHSRHVNTNTHTHTHRFKERQLNTHTDPHNRTEKVTHAGWTPGDQGKRKKLKSCAALHAFSRVHGKFPSSNLTGEPKQASHWYRVPSCVHTVELQLLYLTNNVSERWLHSMGCSVSSSTRPGWVLKSEWLDDKRHSLILCK